MRTLLVAAMLIGGTIPSDLSAQRGSGGGGAHGGGAGHSGFGFGFGAGRVGRFGGRFGNRFGGRFGNGFGQGLNNGGGFGGWGGWGGWGDYGWGDWGGSPYFGDLGTPPEYGSGNQNHPNHPGTMLVVPPLSPAPPPQPAQAVIREYNWSAGGTDANATFSIAPKNGEVRHAVAVWMQDNEVRFTDTDGRAGRMPPAAVDCGATDRLNAQKNLRLSLPGCGLSR